MPIKLACALLPWVLASVAAAQAPAQAYTWAPNDTIRYDERTRHTSTFWSPGSPVSTHSEHVARIAGTAEGDSTITLWYEYVRVREASGADPEVAPRTVDLIGRAFRIRMDSAGRVTVLSTPEMPRGISQVTDLRRQFDDFFISLPPGTLAAGMAWSDTLLDDRAGEGELRRQSTRVRMFEVLGDTVVHGRPAVLLEVVQELSSSGESTIEGQAGVTVAHESEGWEEGTAIFDTDRGRLLHRAREGATYGTMKVRGSGETVTLEHDSEYTSTIDIALPGTPLDTTRTPLVDSGAVALVAMQQAGLAALQESRHLDLIVLAIDGLDGVEAGNLISEYTQRGVRRLSAGQLHDRAVIQSRMFELGPVAACAAVSRGTPDTRHSAVMLMALDSATVRHWFDLGFEALVAELEGYPEATTMPADSVEAVLAGAGRYLEPALADTLTGNLARLREGDWLDDETQCAVERALWRAAAGLDQGQPRASLLRALSTAQDDPDPAEPADAP